MRTGRRQPLEAVAAVRVLPLIVLDDAAAARPLGEALLAGGLDVVEVAFRTPSAAATLRSMAAVPGLCVGAGTVLTPEQVDRAVEAGAAFIVTPGLDVRVLERCASLAVPVFPGVATPTDVIAALTHGLGVVKLFPAQVLGGTAMISALAAPFADVQFIPTGGINATTLPAYLAHPAVLAVGGSWMVPSDLVRAAEWDRLTTLARETSVAAGARP